MDRKRTRQDKTRIDKTIGMNIREEREARRITRDELAEVIDLTTSHLGLIERGERGATPVTLEKLVRAFGITIDSLFVESNKGMSARERRERAKDTYRKKVSTLISHLTETELELLSYTIKGIVKTRPADSTVNTDAINEFLREAD